MGGWRGVRTGRFTYAKRETRRALDPWLLYDNQKDPYQMRNVIEEPAYRQRREELEAMLVQWLNRVGEA
jgi:arylsulfatase A-like enzyme